MTNTLRHGAGLCAIAEGIVQGPAMLERLEGEGVECDAGESPHDLIELLQRRGRRIGPGAYTLVRMRLERRDAPPVLDYWVLGAARAR